MENFIGQEDREGGREGRREREIERDTETIHVIVFGFL